MFKGLLTPCKKCVEGQCGLWVKLTWKDEVSKKEKDISECAITGIYGFLARMENRLIGAQKASEQARNNSANVQAAQKQLAQLLTSSVPLLMNEITEQIINKVLEVTKPQDTILVEHRDFVDDRKEDIPVKTGF